MVVVVHPVAHAIAMENVNVLLRLKKILVAAVNQLVFAMPTANVNAEQCKNNNIFLFYFYK